MVSQNFEFAIALAALLVGVAFIWVAHKHPS